MSFSKKLKIELSSIKMSECCRIAECYGIMLFGQSFCDKKISILTDSEAVAQNFIYLLKKCFNINESISSSNGKRPMYKVKITDKTDILKIIPNTDISEFLYKKILIKDCCRNAFIRGMFLSCGQCQNPEKSTRIDMKIKNHELLPIVLGLLNDADIEPNLTVRDDKDILYIKNSETVEDFITVMGAGNITLELMDLKIIKDVRNNINRKNNAGIANTSKTIEASVYQRGAIKFLITNEKFQILSPALQEIALLRTSNPEAPLSELCKLSSFPLTRSGLNHRIKKIVETAEKYGYKG